MISEKFVRIILRLIASTKSGKLKWSESPVSGRYDVAFANYTLSISSEAGRIRGNTDIVIRIHGPEGDILDQITDEEFSSNEFYFGDKTPFAALNDLYHDARRNAVGIDQALDSILDELPEE